MSHPSSSLSTGGYFSAQALARGLGPSTSTSLIAGDRRKIHTSFPQKGAEMVEEYDVSSDQLVQRKLRLKSHLGNWGEWEFEIGEPVHKFNPEKEIMSESSNNVRRRYAHAPLMQNSSVSAQTSCLRALLLASLSSALLLSSPLPSAQPLFVRQDTPSHFEFRIRNLPYPAETYLLSIDDASQEIILRTSNKKYYKKMSIPDMKIGEKLVEGGGKLEQKYISYKHANNTLIISASRAPSKENSTQ